MPRAPIDQNEILDALTVVFRDYGYQGATIGRLCDATGLRRASLYHHFPDGKESMAAAGLRRSMEIFWDTVLPPLREPGDAAQRIDRMLDNLDAYYRSGHQSCLLGVMALDNAGDAIGAHVQSGFTTWITALSDVIEQNGINKDLAQARAEDAVIRVQGALVLCRGLQRTEPFARTLESVRRALHAPA